MPVPNGLPLLAVATTEASSLVAAASFQLGEVHVYDVRQLPLAPAASEWEQLSAASRRALVATVALPEGTASARALQLSDAQLVASLEDDFTTSVFSRAAQDVAVYDFRAAGSRGFAPPPLWTWRVEGGVSCLQCRSDRLVVGCCSGHLLVWSAGRQHAAAGSAHEELAPPRKQRREKPRHNPKIRGRFPKTQGFSNQKGF